jgi:hypothetical protein
MKFASLIALSITACCPAGDVLLNFGRGMQMWTGGVAIDIGGGSWVGSGWGRYPGISPPWDPVLPPVRMPQPALVQPALVPPTVVVMPAPVPVPPKTYTLWVAGEPYTVLAAQPAR